MSKIRRLKLNLLMMLPSLFEISLLFVAAASSSSQHSSINGEGNHRLADSLRELHRRTAAEVAAPAPGSWKRKGRVVYPVDYGADPWGKEDSSGAIMAALREAFEGEESSGGREMLKGVKDLGGVVVDLQGGDYLISNPIRFPDSGGANLVVKAGSLRASDKFPGNRHLVEIWSSKSKPLHTLDVGAAPPSDPIYYEDITFRDILFDSSFRGGGFLAVDAARIRITDCYFLHFTTQGILIHKGHDTLISSTFLGQHSTVGGDPGERQFSGYAIDLSSNDNVVTDVVIFSAAVGILIRGQANMITGVHCYNKATWFGGIGIWIRIPGISQTRIDNCYMDYTAIVMEDPVQVHVTNGFFLGDANVVLKAAKGVISGVNIVDNMFTGEPKNMKSIVEVHGRFSEIDQVVIERNNVNGMTLKTTAAQMAVAGNGTRWKLDLAAMLVFPNMISHVQYSFYYKSGGFVMHGLTNVSDNVVVVESDRAVDAVVSAVVDQYNMIGERPPYGT